MRDQRATWLGVWLAVSLVLAGCAGAPVVSVDAARAVAADLGGPVMVPPRRIDDITAVLARSAPEPARVAALRAKADAMPPASASEAALFAFYRDRGLAAGELGRFQQQIGDLEQAVALARGGAGDLVAALETLFFAYLNGGVLDKALEARRERARLKDADLSDALTFMSFAASLGDFAEAERWGRQVDAFYRDFFSSKPAPVVAAFGDIVRKNYHQAWGHYHFMAGRYDQAEADLRKAVHHGALAVDAGDTAVSRRLTAAQLWRDLIANRDRLSRALAWTGRPVEAEAEARQGLAEALRAFGRESVDVGRSLVYLAEALEAQGRYPEAERIAREGLAIMDRVGASPDSLHVLLLRLVAADNALLMGRPAEAIPLYEAAAGAVERSPLLQRLPILHRAPRVIAYYEAGRIDQGRRAAEAMLARHRATLGDGAIPTAMAEGLVAVGMLGQGDREGAEGVFRRVLPVLLGWDEEKLTPSRVLYRRYVLERYLEVLAERGAAADVATAFRIADYLRGRGIQSAIGAVAGRAAARSPDLAELARGEQDIGNQIEARGEILKALLGLGAEDKAAAIRAEIESLRQARAVLRGEIEARFPDYAALVEPAPATVDQARAALHPGEAMVVIHEGRTRGFVWAFGPDGPVSFATVALGAERLAEQVAALRSGVDVGAGTLAAIPPYDVATAHALYAAILAPVAAGWREAETLIVVPDRHLARIPFSTLVSRPPPKVVTDAPGAPLFSGYASVDWLIRDHAIAQVPTVTALVALRRMPASGTGRTAFIGFGDPYFSPQQASEAWDEQAVVQRRRAPTRSAASATLAMLPRLPETADELREIAVALGGDPDRDVYLGEKANERTVKSADLSSQRVVAFATHGLTSGELNGQWQPALALTAPDVAGITGDGLLMADEVLGLSLDADWVVLSACNTAADEGGEMLSGLGRAFFYAGARAILATGWAVETTSARALTSTLFRIQSESPRLSRAQALRRAMVGLIDGAGARDARGRVVFSYAHPLFWAPYGLYGDGGAPALTASPSPRSAPGPAKKGLFAERRGAPRQDRPRHPRACPGGLWRRATDGEMPGTSPGMTRHGRQYSRKNQKKARRACALAGFCRWCCRSDLNTRPLPYQGSAVEV